MSNKFEDEITTLDGLKVWRVTADGETVHYVTGHRIPPRIPAGYMLRHNHITPKIWANGFRAWFALPEPDDEVCDCGWAPRLGAHYK